MNRPVRKHTKPKEAKYDASLLLIQRSPVLAGLKPSQEKAPQESRGSAARGLRIAPAGGNGRRLGRHVVDQEAEDAGLRRHVKELGRDRHREVRMRPDRMEPSGVESSRR